MGNNSGFVCSYSQRVKASTRCLTGWRASCWSTQRWRATLTDTPLWTVTAPSGRRTSTWRGPQCAATSCPVCWPTPSTSSGSSPSAKTGRAPLHNPHLSPLVSQNSNRHLRKYYPSQKKTFEKFVNIYAKLSLEHSKTSKKESKVFNGILKRFDQTIKKILVILNSSIEVFFGSFWENPERVKLRAQFSI